MKLSKVAFHSTIELVLQDTKIPHGRVKHLTFTASHFVVRGGAIERELRCVQGTDRMQELMRESHLQELDSSEMEGGHA